MALLSCRNLCRYFGGVKAVENVSFDVGDGELLGLIGPNGAGKSTIFNLISGIYPPQSGTIEFDGRNITGCKPHENCRIGLGRTFQRPRIFSQMTVLDNVVIGSLFACNTEKACARNEGLELLDSFGLVGFEDSLAGSLTAGCQKKVELCRILATRPKLLLLDEPFAGLNPTETKEMSMMIAELREKIGTVFMIEHVMEAVMNLSSRVIVLNNGKKIAEGIPEVIAKDEEVIRAYLGEEYRLT